MVLTRIGSRTVYCKQLEPKGEVTKVEPGWGGAANLVAHGHVRYEQLDGRNTAGIPVDNVAITLLQAKQPSAVYRVFVGKLM